MPDKLLEIQYSSGRYFTLIYSDSGGLQRERGYPSLPEAATAYEDLLVGVIDGSLDPAQPVFRQDLEDCELPPGIQISHHDVKDLPGLSRLALGNRRLRAVPVHAIICGRDTSAQLPAGARIRCESGQRFRRRRVASRRTNRQSFRWACPA